MSKEVTIVVQISFLGHAGHGIGHAVLPLTKGVTGRLEAVLDEAMDKARADSAKLFADVVTEATQ